MTSEPSGSGSGSRPCGTGCAWRYDNDLGCWVALHGCADEDKWCDPPAYSSYIKSAAAYKREPACTSCYTPEEMQMLARAAAESKLAVKRFGVIIPKISEPARIGRFSDVVALGGTNQIYSPTYGWLVKVRSKFQTPGSTPQPLTVEPTNQPVVCPKFSETAFSVGIMLEEGPGVLEQYWLNVTASQGWSVLTTAEWDVLVVRMAV